MISLNPQNRGTNTTLVGFLSLSIIAIGTLVYLSLNQKPIPLPSLEMYSSLADTYRQDGIEAFLRQKVELKRRVQIAMDKNGDLDPETENIAVYLFPDALPNENLEREVGSELWQKHQEAIENSPGTEASRAEFEKMRANIWNYEIASHSSPQLSVQARHVLKIYEVMSAR